MRNHVYKGAWSLVEEKLPPPEERVIVDCTRYRCLGYRDESGVWRWDGKDEKLEQVVAWKPIKE